MNPDESKGIEKVEAGEVAKRRVNRKLTNDDHIPDSSDGETEPADTQDDIFGSSPSGPLGPDEGCELVNPGPKTPPKSPPKSEDKSTEGIADQSMSWAQELSDETINTASAAAMTTACQDQPETSNGRAMRNSTKETKEAGYYQNLNGTGKGGQAKPTGAEPTAAKPTTAKPTAAKQKKDTKEMQKIKDELEKIKEENEKNLATIRQVEAERNIAETELTQEKLRAIALVAQNTDLKKKNAEKIRDMNKLKAETSSQKTEIAQLSQQKSPTGTNTSQYRRTIDNLQVEVSDLKKVLKKKQEEHDNMIASKDQDNENLAATNTLLLAEMEEIRTNADTADPESSQAERIIELEALVENLYDKIAEKDSDHDDSNMTLEVEAPAPKKRGLLIADSNRKHIVPDLEDDDSNEWAHTDNLFTVKKLSEAVDDNLLAMDDGDFDAVYIMQATNDLVRNGDDGIKIAKKLAQTVREMKEKFKNTRIVAVEIPPLTDSKLATERFLFNKTIKGQDIPVVKIADKFGAEKLKDVLDLKDGIHITKKGAGIIAQEIKKDLEENTDNTSAASQNVRTVKEPQEEKTWEIPKGAVKFIIGTQGSIIHKIEGDHNVKIDIKKSERDYCSKVTISGQDRRHISQAIEQVQKIVSKYEEDQTKFDKKKGDARNIPCRYNQDGGKCRRGDKCMYSHAPAQPERGRQSSRKQPTENKQRSRSRIDIKRK